MAAIVSGSSSKFADPADFSSFQQYLYFGYEVVKWAFSAHRKGALIVLNPTAAPVCPKCGRSCSRIKETRARKIRDCAVPGCEYTVLFVPVRRVRCDCGCLGTEILPWIAKHGRITLRFAAQVQCFLRQGQPVSWVAQQFHLDWGTVKKLDKMMLKKFYEHVDVSRLRRLAIDEFALQKAHKYATTFMDLDTGKIIFVCRGKTNAAVRKGFEMLKAEGVLDQIQTVAMDMNAGWPKLVKEYLPKADISYDLFHVIANFTADVVKEARLEMIRRADAADKKGERKRLKGCEYLIVMKEDRLTHEQSARLEGLLKDNEMLNALLPIADILRSIWRAPSAFVAEQQLKVTISLLKEVNKEFHFPPAKRFAAMLKRRSDGILSAYKHGVGTNKLEGANNRIKVLKRTGYGFRDDEYFFLKIKSVINGETARMQEMSREMCTVWNDQIIKTGMTKASEPGLEVPWPFEYRIRQRKYKAPNTAASTAA